MQTTVTIPGIHCASCASLIKDVSSEFPEIRNANVDFGTKTVILDHDERFNVQKWTKEIESLDSKYKIQSIQTL